MFSICRALYFLLFCNFFHDMHILLSLGQLPLTEVILLLCFDNELYDIAVNLIICWFNCFAQLDGGAPELILHEKERPDLPQSLYPDPEITRNSLVYRIKDEIVYSMMVEELQGDTWMPFVSSDMQMEFMMLDPYVRKTMVVDPSTGRHVASFIAPDSYGIFKFRVLYRRVGYSVLHAETQVSIRPFKHNEYERFIFSAYPYYSSAFSAMIAFFVFSMFFLFSDDKRAKTV